MNINGKSSKKLLLKGMCKEEIDEASFDQEFYVDGIMNGRLLFK